MKMSELPDSLKKCMSPEDRKQFGREAQTYDEAEAGACVKLEKTLHNQYVGFLNHEGFNMDRVLHAPMHRRSHLPPGFPDFCVMRSSRTLFIEFKIAKNKLDPDQEKWINAAAADCFDVFVFYSLAPAIAATRSYFNL